MQRKIATITYHCPKCYRRRPHYLRVAGGIETLICKQCHNIIVFVQKDSTQE